MELRPDSRAFPPWQVFLVSGALIAPGSAVHVENIVVPVAPSVHVPQVPILEVVLDLDVLVQGVWWWRGRRFCSLVLMLRLDLIAARAVFVRVVTSPG